MKIFGRRRRSASSTSTQTLSTVESASNTSDDIVQPNFSVSESGLRRGRPTRDKATGVSRNNMGELYTPMGSISTVLDAGPPGSRTLASQERRSSLDALSERWEDPMSSHRDVATSITQPPELASMQPLKWEKQSSPASLPWEEPTSYRSDTATSVFRPWEETMLSTRKTLSSQSQPRDVDTSQRGLAAWEEPTLDQRNTTLLQSQPPLSSRRDVATSFSRPWEEQMLGRRSESTQSPPLKESISPRRDVGTSVSRPWEEPMFARRNGSSQYQSLKPSTPSRRDVGTSAPRPWEEQALARRSSMSSWEEPTPASKDVGTQPCREPSPPQREAATSVPTSLRGSLVRHATEATQTSSSLSQTPRMSAQTQTESAVALPDFPPVVQQSFGQWMQEDPQDLALRMTLMSWLSKTSTLSSPRSFATAVTQTAVDDKPSEDAALVVVGKRVTTFPKPSHRSRSPAIESRSSSRPLKAKKSTSMSPYASSLKEDRPRRPKPVRRGLQFEAKIPKDHVVLIQSPGLPGTDPTCNCQVLIRPADTDSDANYISIITPDGKPPTDYTTTYKADFSDKPPNP